LSRHFSCAASVWTGLQFICAFGDFWTVRLDFPAGLQAYHAWKVESFRQVWFATLEPRMN
jgi:hypothetical protein